MAIPIFYSRKKFRHKIELCLTILNKTVKANLGIESWN